MDPIIKLEVNSKIHFVVIPHIQDIEIISGKDNPQINIYLNGKTLEIPVYDLKEMEEVKKQVHEQYERDWQEYKKSKEENIKNINNIAQTSLEPLLTKDVFRASKSLLPFRGAKLELIRKFAAFIFNCLNHYWAHYGTEGRKHISSLSIPSVADSDHSIEHIFVSLMKDVKGFDVYSLYKRDLIQQMIMQGYDSCKAVTKPVQGAYKPESEKTMGVATSFVENIIKQIFKYYEEEN